MKINQLSSKTQQYYTYFFTIRDVTDVSDKLNNNLALIPSNILRTFALSKDFTSIYEVYSTLCKLWRQIHSHD